MWRAYEFPHKPGELARRPTWVAPHQPRLDWQLWFAALGSPSQNPWVLGVCEHLLRGTPEVLRLLGTNPFPEKPPRFIRVVRYEYHFTDAATRASTGNWWRRTPLDFYVPQASLK
jgi:lipase maturation factor 1